MQEKTPFTLRMHRAESWLKKAEETEDDDTRFITLWIAFNAAYANELPGMRASDKSSLSRFLNLICTLDRSEDIYHLVWQRFSGSIRLLLNTPYVFQPFWDYHNQLISESAWQEDFQRAKVRVNRALAEQDTSVVLSTVFERIYTLRNQIIHGGASFGSRANRTQVRNCCAILLAFLPLMFAIMRAHPDANWGKPFYPLISDPTQP